MLRMELAVHGSDASAGHRLTAAGAQRTALGMVMGLTVRHALVIEERTTIEWHVAFHAYEALRVPLSTQRRYIVLHDWSIARATLGSKHFEVILPAVCPPFLFVKTFFPERAAALSAKEMLGVPGLVESRDTFVKNGVAAVGAFGREQLVVIVFAEWFAVPLEEVLRSEFDPAVGAHKVLRMPRSA